jgi:hypothetical protein
MASGLRVLQESQEDGTNAFAVDCYCGARCANNLAWELRLQFDAAASHACDNGPFPFEYYGRESGVHSVYFRKWFRHESAVTGILERFDAHQHDK